MSLKLTTVDPRSPTKTVSKNSAARSPSPNSTAKTNQALKMHPYLSPKSETFLNSSTSVLTSETPSKLASTKGKSSTKNSATKESKVLKATLQKSKSPNPRPISANRLVSPPRNNRSINGSDQITSPQKSIPTEKVSEKIEERTKLKEQGKKLGEEVLETLQKRKEMETQLVLLQNRIKKLEMEDNTIKKKIEKTSEQTEKVLEAKKVHQEKLSKKEKIVKEKEDVIIQLKEEVKIKKEKTENKLHHVHLELNRSKKEIAEVVKVENQNQKKLRTTLRENEFKKNKEIIEKIAKEREIKAERQKSRDEEKKVMARQSYTERVGKETAKIDDLAEKCKDLEKIEHQLLERLSNTHSLHRAKISELEKAFSLKVTARDPVVLPTTEENREEAEEEEEVEEEEEENQEDEEEEVEAGEDD